MNDICCIGHITLDKIVTPKQTTYMPGGTSYYFSHGIRRLNDFKNYKLVTAVAPSEYGIVEEMRKEGLQVEVLPSRHTVYFENTYEENQDNRSQRVLAKADPFTADALKDENARIFHLGSLLADDFPLEVVKELAQKGTLAVDAQGYLREVKGEQVYPVDWHEKKKALKYIDILKVNEHEAEVLTGFKDPQQAARQLAQPTPRKKWWMPQDVEIPMYSVICTCATKVHPMQKPDVLLPPCRPSNWKNQVLFPERKKRCGISCKPTRLSRKCWLPNKQNKILHYKERVCTLNHSAANPCFLPVIGSRIIPSYPSDKHGYVRQPDS